jgi:hypothetical protein
MCRSRVSKVLIAAAAIVALSAAPSYGSQSQVLTDCSQTGALNHTYTLSDLRGALAVMPTAMREYTNCPDVIQRALLAKLGTPTGKQADTNGGSGGSFLPTPVIIILVVLAAATAGYAVMAVRRRGEGDGEPPESE